MRIYVAGPLTGKTPEQQLKNVHRAMEVGGFLLKMGHVPFVPHMTHHFDQYMQSRGVHVSYEQWMAWDDSWLQACDALFYLAPSPGADRELARAIRLRLRIYSNLSEIPPA